MKLLGKAKLVEHSHSSGVRAKSWDLSPWGGPMVFMGAVTQPLPPVGKTTDRGNLRLDSGSGDVWMLEEGDPPPTLPGPVGIAGKAAGMIVPLGIAAIAWFWGLYGRRR